MGDNNVPRFTPRQKDIIQRLCVLDHKLQKEIAVDMGVSYYTLKIHLRRIFEKLDWKYGQTRMLVLWVMRYREILVKEQGFVLDFEIPEQPIFGS